MLFEKRIHFLISNKFTAIRLSKTFLDVIQYPFFPSDAVSERLVGKLDFITKGLFGERAQLALSSELTCKLTGVIRQLLRSSKWRIRRAENIYKY